MVVSNLDQTCLLDEAVGSSVSSSLMCDTGGGWVVVSGIDVSNWEVAAWTLGTVHWSSTRLMLVISPTPGGLTCLQINGGWRKTYLICSVRMSLDMILSIIVIIRCHVVTPSLAFAIPCRDPPNRGASAYLPWSMRINNSLENYTIRHTTK